MPHRLMLSLMLVLLILVILQALAMLQSGGRLIGIISHVSELKNRIPCRVEVNRDAAGFSHAAIKT